MRILLDTQIVLLLRSVSIVSQLIEKFGYICMIAVEIVYESLQFAVKWLVLVRQQLYLDRIKITALTLAVTQSHADGMTGYYPPIIVPALIWLFLQLSAHLSCNCRSLSFSPFFQCFGSRWRGVDAWSKRTQRVLSPRKPSLCVSTISQNRVDRIFISTVV